MEKTITIGEIASRVTRHPLMRDIPFETILAYTVDFIQMVGLPELFEEKTTLLKVENWRTILPCDFVRIIQLRTAPKEDRYKTYRAATSSFHMSPEHTPTLDLTYKIQGDFIYTSNKEGIVEIAYMAFATDNEGYPLIPDNGIFPRAVEDYIKKEWFTVLFDLNRISQQVLNNAQQQYAWSSGKAVETMRLLSLDKAESLINQWTSLLIRPNEHRTVFGNSGAKQFIKTH